MTTRLGAASGAGKAWSRARHAAGDLQIDDAVADAVARDDLAQHDAERGKRHRHADAQFVERALEPRHVAPLVDQPPSPHLADFVDAVGELIAAILDVDLGVAHAADSGR